MISHKHFKRSLKHAARGIEVVFAAEQSFRIQVFIAILVLILAFVLQVRASELIVLLLLIGSVLALEMINSIFERIVDTFKPRIHPAVRDIKDIMAAAVLVVSVIAALIGLVIFVPRIIGLF